MTGERHCVRDGAVPDDAVRDEKIRDGAVPDDAIPDDVVRDGAVRDDVSDEETVLTERVDLADQRTPTAETGSAGVSRRSVLRTGASAVAGGALLSGVAGRARATSHGGSDRPLDVRTTNVEVLGNDGGETEGKTKTFGEVDGMDQVNCRRCRVGAQVSRPDHDKWYGGLQRVVTARNSFRVAVTLAGLRPGRYQFRLVACPVTHNHLCFGNSITIVVRFDRRKKHGQNEDDHDGCPCGADHDEGHHLTLCSDDWRSARDYGFAVSDDHVRKSRRSCAPSAISHDKVTVDPTDSIRGGVVTGALAGGGDSFLFDGDVTDLRCDDGVGIYLDGERFDGY